MSLQLTVGAYLGEWLSTSVASRSRPTTASSYRNTVRRYIAPTLGRLPLAKLDPSDVRWVLAERSHRGDLSPTTIR